MSVTERRRREREARSRTILAAAARVFASHGLEGSTIEMVAREAEVAVGTIYLHFASRDDLFLSLMAERGTQLRRRYDEIQARDLDPESELRAMMAAYIDYMRESRELFLVQQSVAYEQIYRRLKRRAEVQTFNRVVALGRETFGMWERSVARVFEKLPERDRPAHGTIAAVMWAGLNGAFILVGNDKLFREVTGLDSDRFVERTFEMHLAAARRGLAGNHAVRRRAPLSGRRNGVARSKSREFKTDGIDTPRPT